MTSSVAFVDALDAAGIRFVSGVPCSWFGGPLRLLEDHRSVRYTPAVNEGSALAMAVGSRLAGTPSAVIAQNSGFGNLINPLTSLVLPYRIPVLVMMSMRGWPASGPGEQQHAVMGSVVPSWLDSMDVPYTMLVEGGSFTEALGEARAELDSGRTTFLLVGKGAIEGAPPRAPASGVTRAQLLAAVTAERRDEYVLSTTGYLSRELFAAGDRPENFYMQGSMGHVSGIALGAALQRPDRRFVVLDGDGAMLMHLGAVTTVATSAPTNLVHVVFDNGGYESTGGQPTAAAVDFAGIARSAGYRSTITVETADALRPGIRTALHGPKPALVVVRGVPGGPAAGRASESLDVTDMAARFAKSLVVTERGAP